MTIAKNRTAFFKYAILEEFEAGIALTGAEVKSLRNHSADLKNSYASVESGEVYLVNAHISPYEKATNLTYEPKRKRKLLLKKKEIKKQSID